MPLETAAAAARVNYHHQPENFPCPRCDSTNTKFCYYNNYNLSQPRHFCKSCRRYWTRGGTLRNVPFGGATRKNPLKRSRPSAVSASPSSAAVPDSNRSSINLFPKLDDAATAFYSDLSANENYQFDPVPTIPGAFTSLLVPGGGLFGYDMEAGSGGAREMEFGLNIGLWPMEEIGGGGVVGGGGDSGAAWEERGLTDSECFDWPELAISTPGRKAMK